MPSFFSLFSSRAPSRPRRRAAPAPTPRSTGSAVSAGSTSSASEDEEDPSYPRLDFWVIRSEKDRNALPKIIKTYMINPMEEKDLPSTLVKEKPWLKELIKPEGTSKSSVDEQLPQKVLTPATLEQFRATEAAFWRDPEDMMEELRDITRYWFWIVLRYTFRTRHQSGWKKSSALRWNLEDADEKDIFKALDEKQKSSLLRRPKLHSDYKDSFSETKRRAAWTQFRARVELFCRIIGSNSSSNKLEQILQDLETALPRLKADRTLRLNDSLLLCRQLMESLLPDSPGLKTGWRPRGQEYGKRWRDLWADEWKKCKDKRPAGHPLLGLVDTQKYYLVGEKLYGTLSERLHNHQEHRDKMVDGDVLRVVFSILPPVFSMPPIAEVERKWDLDAEKKRWGLT